MGSIIPDFFCCISIFILFSRICFILLILSIFVDTLLGTETISSKTKAGILLLDTQGGVFDSSWKLASNLALGGLWGFVWFVWLLETSRYVTVIHSAINIQKNKELLWKQRICHFPQKQKFSYNRDYVEYFVLLCFVFDRILKRGLSGWIKVELDRSWWELKNFLLKILQDKLWIIWWTE